tara:strand:- start:80 stop:532 length:453 start_codon:yes stop_codon:yes gene_type:complete
MKIDIIILAALALVFVVDYFVRNKKSLKTEIESKPKKDNLQKDRPKIPNKTQVRFFNYISRRPKNLIIFLIFVFLNKLCLHYFFYRADAFIQSKPGPNNLDLPILDIVVGHKSFIWHIENILTVETKLFIPALAICIIVSYLISDKIKAR